MISKKQIQKSQCSNPNSWEGGRMFYQPSRKSQGLGKKKSPCIDFNRNCIFFLLLSASSIVGKRIKKFYIHNLTYLTNLRVFFLVISLKNKYRFGNLDIFSSSYNVI